MPVVMLKLNLTDTSALIVCVYWGTMNGQNYRFASEGYLLEAEEKKKKQRLIREQARAGGLKPNLSRTRKDQ